MIPVETNAKPHEIQIMIREDKITGKWRIRINGITSGARIHVADEMAIEFALDASRFYPALKST